MDGCIVDSVVTGLEIREGELAAGSSLTVEFGDQAVVFVAAILTGFVLYSFQSYKSLSKTNELIEDTAQAIDATSERVAASQQLVQRITQLIQGSDRQLESINLDQDELTIQ